MKRHIVTVSLLGTMLGAGALNAQAAPPANQQESFSPVPAGDVPPPEKMAPPRMDAPQQEKNSLHLNADQEKKIAGILADEREKASPLLKKLETLRGQLHQAELAPILDEPALRAIAEGLSKTETELIVSHTKMNRRVMAVLTADQREQLQKQAPDRNFPPVPPGPERATGADSGNGQ
ncbi:MAG: Spy/CpxP family protein refolding chaperone [Geobacteraceae bacterium]